MVEPLEPLEPLDLRPWKMTDAEWLQNTVAKMLVVNLKLQSGYQRDPEQLAQQAADALREIKRQTIEGSLRV